MKKILIVPHYCLLPVSSDDRLGFLCTAVQQIQKSQDNQLAVYRGILEAIGTLNERVDGLTEKMEGLTKRVESTEMFSMSAANDSRAAVSKVSKSNLVSSTNVQHLKIV